MGTSFQVDTTVQPDGSIRIPVSGLKPGQRVSVSIEPDDEAPVLNRRTGPAVIDILATLPGQRIFHTAEEVDEYIREERDAWDR